MSPALETPDPDMLLRERVERLHAERAVRAYQAVSALPADTPPVPLHSPGVLPLGDELRMRFEGCLPRVSVARGCAYALALQGVAALLLWCVLEMVHAWRHA